MPRKAAKKAASAAPAGGSRRSSRRAPAAEASDDGGDDDVREVAASPEASDRAARAARKRDRGAEEAAGRLNAARPFKLFRDATTGAFATDPLDTAKSVLDDVKDKERAKAEALAPDELDALIGKMARYLLLRGTKKAPIVKSKLADAVMGDYKKTRITNYVFGKAVERLKRTWGYDVVPAPAACGALEYRGQARDSWRGLPALPPSVAARPRSPFYV